MSAVKKAYYEENYLKYKNSKSHIKAIFHVLIISIALVTDMTILKSSVVFSEWENGCGKFSLRHNRKCGW